MNALRLLLYISASPRDRDYADAVCGVRGVYEYEAEEPTGRGGHKRIMVAVRTEIRHGQSSIWHAAKPVLS